MDEEILSEIEPNSAIPLLSWDIFLEGHQRRMELAEDRNKLQKLASRYNWQHQFNFDKHLFKLRNSILVTDPWIKIVYASTGIFYMNGYNPGELIGKSPKLFQGSETSHETSSMIGSSIAKRVPFKASILNYRKTGEPYTCDIEGYPIFNSSKELVHFIAFETLTSPGIAQNPSF